MRDNRKSKLILIISLVVSITILGIGFAAFSNTLKISSKAEYTPDPSSFKVVLSSTRDTTTTGKVTPTVSNGSVATSATLTETTVSGLTVTFDDIRQEVTYEFYIQNVGSINAYLNSVDFENIPGTNSFKKCTAMEGTTDSLVQSECDNINVSMYIYDLINEDKTISIFGSYSQFNNYKIAPKETGFMIKLILTYRSGAPMGTINLADGDFKVEFGDIVFNYSSVD